MISRPERDNRKNQRSENGCKVFLGGLPTTCTDKDLHSLMSRYGRVVDASVVRMPTGESKGFGFVIFQSSAEAAASYGVIQLGHKTIEVKPSVKNTYDHHYKTGPRNQKENIQACALKDSAESHSQVPSAGRTPTKLSRHSQNFETHPTTLQKIPSFYKEEEKVTVNVIQLKSQQDISKTTTGHSLTGHSQKSISSDDMKLMAQPGDVKPRKDSEKVGGGISKMSKEFHPTSVPDKGFELHKLAQSTYVQPHFYYDNQSNANQNLFANPFLSFSSDPRCASDYMRHAKTESFGLMATKTDLRINFFTFPGRD